MKRKTHKNELQNELTKRKMSSQARKRSNNGRSFTQVQDVRLQSRITALSINPKIDCFAFATEDGTLCVLRIDGERLWRQICPGNECTSLQWRQCGRVLACGRKQGEVELFRVEGDGEVSFLIESICFDRSRVGDEDDDDDDDESRKNVTRTINGKRSNDSNRKSVSPICSLCWIEAEQGQFGKDDVTNRVIAKEFEALARDYVQFGDVSKASRFHARPKINQGKSFNNVRGGAEVDLEDEVDVSDVLDADDVEEDEHYGDADGDLKWSKDEILDHKVAPSQMNVLIAGDAVGNVACFGFGAFPLFWQKLPKKVGRVLENSSRCSVEKISMSKDQTAICARINRDIYALMSFDLLSQTRVKATYDFSFHAAHTSQILRACLSSVATLSKRWKVAQKTAFYQTIIGFAIASIDPDEQRYLLEEKPKKENSSAGASYLRGDDDDENENKMSINEIIADEKIRAQFCEIFCKDALSLFETGSIERGIEHFFALVCRPEELKKRARSLDQETNVAHDVLVKKVAPGLSAAFSRLRELRGLSRWRKHAKPLGLREETLDRLCEETELACLACHEAATMCTIVGSRNRSIFAFLLRAQKRAETGMPLAAVPNLPESNAENIFDALNKSSELSVDYLENHFSRHDDSNNNTVVRNSSVENGLRDRLESLLKTWDKDLLRETSGTIEANIKTSFVNPAASVSNTQRVEDILSANASFMSSGSLELNEHFQNAVRNGYQFGKDVIASNFGEGDTSGGLYDDAVEPIDVLEYTNGRVLTLVVPKSKTGEKNNNDIIAIDDMDITKQQTAVLVLTGDTSIFNDDEEEEEVRKCRRLPADATGPIECSTSRGLVAIRCGNNRFIVLDLEEDEEDEDDDDREDE